MTNKLITRKFLASFKFRNFRESDHMMFQGAESPVPMIAERDSFCIIIDGVRCELYLDGYEEGAFETCEDITALTND